MKNTFLLAAASALLLASAVQADEFAFNVDLNTSSLAGNPDGPFSLDFQLNGTANNTVFLNNFAFANGTPLGTPSYSSNDGSVSGDLGSSVVLSDATDAFTEFYQGFSAGTTEINFDATFLSTNVNPVTPDAFSVAILDSGLNNIPTTSFADTLVLLNVDATPLTVANVETDSSLAPDAGVTASVTPAPEPGTGLMALGVGLVALGWRARRSRQSGR